MAAVSAKVQDVTLGQQGEQLYLCLQIPAWQKAAIGYHLHMANLPASVMLPLSTSKALHAIGVKMS